MKYRYLIFFILFASIIWAQTTSPFNTKLEYANGSAATGLDVDLYYYSSDTKAYDLTEINPGVYYHASVAHGEYYLYVGGVNKKQLWHGTRAVSEFLNAVDPDADNYIDGARMEDSTIALSKFTTAAYNYIGSGGNITNNPDDITIENKSGSTLGIKSNFLSDSLTASDTTDLQTRHVVAGGIIHVKQMAAGNTSGVITYMAVDSSAYFAAHDSYNKAEMSNPNIYPHPTDGLIWVALPEYSRSTINVMDYGAIPGDGIDDSPAFRAAASTGRDIFVPGGDFIADSVVLNNWQKIWGVGPPSKITLTDGKKRIFIVTKDGIMIQGLNLQGGGTKDSTVAAIDLQNGTNFTLDRCWIQHFRSDVDTAAGVLLSIGNSSSYRDCNILYNDIGIWCARDVLSANMSVEDCRMGYNRYHSLCWEYSAQADQNIKILGCSFEYQVISTNPTYSYLQPCNPVPIMFKKSVWNLSIENAYAELDTMPFLRTNSSIIGCIRGSTLNGQGTAKYGIIEFTDEVPSAIFSVRDSWWTGAYQPPSTLDSVAYSIGGLWNPDVHVSIYDSYIYTLNDGTGQLDTVQVVHEARPYGYDYNQYLSNSFEFQLQNQPPEGNTAPRVILPSIASNGQVWRKASIGGNPDRMNHIVHFYLDSVLLGPEGSANDSIWFSFWFDDSTSFKDGPFSMDLKLYFIHTNSDSSQWAYYKIHSAVNRSGFNNASNTNSFFTVDSLIRNLSEETVDIPPDESDIWRHNAEDWTRMRFVVTPDANNATGNYWLWIEGEATNLRKITWTSN